MFRSRSRVGVYSAEAVTESEWKISDSVHLWQVTISLRVAPSPGRHNLGRIWTELMEKKCVFFCCEKAAFFKFVGLILDLDFTFEKCSGLRLNLDWVKPDWIWTANYDSQCWTWSGFWIAIQSDSAIQNWIRFGLDLEEAQPDQIWMSKLHWSLQYNA